MTDVILALTTWRIAHILVHEPAPFELLSRFRHRIGVRFGSVGQPISSGELSKLFLCVWCLSIWIGWFIALAHYRSWDFIVYGLAYSAVACLLEGMVSR